MSSFYPQDILKAEAQKCGVPNWQMERLADIAGWAYWAESDIEETVRLSKLSKAEFNAIPEGKRNFKKDGKASAIARPAHIAQPHWDEWIASGVDPAIIAENVRSVDGELAFQIICEHASEKVQNVQSYPTEPLKKILERNEYLIEGGGWWLTGLNPLDNWERMTDWGQLKPNTPRPDVAKPDKLVKYCNPERMETRALFLEHPARRDRWATVQANPEIPVIVCEGGKKAGALISLGYDAIALPGIWGAYRKAEGCVPAHLIPEIEAIASHGRAIVFCFDQDEKESTRDAVKAAIRSTGNLLRAKGCKVGETKWNWKTGKGVDDVLVKKGAEFVKTIIQKGIEDAMDDVVILPKNSAVAESGAIAYEMTDDAATPDHHLNVHFFKEGNGNYCTMDSAFFFHNGSNFWQYVEDDAMLCIIAEQLKKLYVKQTQKIGKQYVEREIKRFATHRNAVSAYGFNRLALAVPREKRKDDRLFINFLNGVLYTKTGELLPYDRSLFLTSQIQANYVPGADCPEAMLKFITTCYGIDKIELIRAIIRYQIDASLPYGYFVHLIGDSGTGKGTLIRFLGNILGKSYKALSEFAMLNTAEGRYQVLTGARLVAFPDVTVALGNMGAFYELVDNGSLLGRPLHCSTTFSREWDCRFILASTQPMQFEKSDTGWDRRCVPISTIGKKSNNIDDSFAAALEACKSDVISWAMGMDKERVMAVIKNPGTVDSNYQSLKDIQAIASDSVKAFIDACLAPSDDDSPMSKATFYGYYKAFCEANKLGAKSSAKFYSSMKTSLGDFFLRDRTSKIIDGAKVNIPSSFTRIQLVDYSLFAIKQNTVEGAVPEERAEYVCNVTLQSEGGLELFRAAKPNSIPTQATQGTPTPTQGTTQGETIDIYTTQSTQGISEVYREKISNENTENMEDIDHNLLPYRGQKSLSNESSLSNPLPEPVSAIDPTLSREELTLSSLSNGSENGGSNGNGHHPKEEAIDFELMSPAEREAYLATWESF
ncbi:MAG TPA: DUF3854 domain-containing protein [Coleofasciculaceae cyanobacterium]